MNRRLSPGAESVRRHIELQAVGELSASRGESVQPRKGDQEQLERLHSQKSFKLIVECDSAETADAVQAIVSRMPDARVTISDKANEEDGASS